MLILRRAMVLWAAGSALLPLESVAAQDVAKPTDRQDAPLVTDRPDFTESTDAVPTGRLQLEGGYTFTFDREGPDRVRGHTAPELLLRVGLAENFELRLGWEGYTWSEEQSAGETRSGRRVTRETWTQGGHDVSLGIKYKLLEQDGAIPHFGVIAEMSVPSGSTVVSSGDVEPGVVLLWAYDVSDSFAVAGNFGLGVPTDGGQRFVQTSASLSFAFSLSERWGAYAEYFGTYPNQRGSDCAHSVNGGLTYLISDDVQLDWRIGAGLNEEADDFFTGVGFAWRW